MFTSEICPQRLHLQGRCRTVLAGFTRSSFPFPQIGQNTHPFSTISLPRISGNFNTFPSFPYEFASYSTKLQVYLINIKHQLYEIHHE